MLLRRWRRSFRRFCFNEGAPLPIKLVLCSMIFSAFVASQEHDSVQCRKTGTCPPATHIVMTLDEKKFNHMSDEERLETAKEIAESNEMIVKGSFLGKHFFVGHADGNDTVDGSDHDERLRRRKRSIALEALRNVDGVAAIIEDIPRVRRKRDYINEPLVHGPMNKRQALFVNQLPQREIPRLPFPDPLYPEQWYLVGRAVGGYDMNVREAWLMGYAGRNVSISILDDGIQRDHPDLVLNYDPLASTDINDHDDDPTPQNNGDNKHGTRCAGEVAATAGNNVCGVGVAFHSRIGGVRMLDGPVSDSVEAASLSLNQDHIDIYSASWGPEDDGKTFDGPGNLAQEAFYRGIKQGRGGRGNIFVWASGNGGSRQDSCSADGYTTSIYTLSISSATYDNHRPWYLEECPSTIASTYSSANINQPAIVTVDVPNGCTKMHTGTSASAPLAAGIIALALEANPSLTWRDMQHLVLRTANPTPLLNNAGWSFNGVGRRVSNKFGYGLMDAGALVKLARTWTTVPEQHMCTYEYSLDSPRPRPLIGNFQLNFSLEVNGCERGTPVYYLEHVQVVTTIRYAKRGDLKLTLFSPMGTRSVLLPPRPQDVNQSGFHKWPFLSVQMWGEDPRGVWTLMVESVTTNPNVAGMFSDWSLLLYGTEDPAQSNDQRYPAQSNAIQRGRSSIISQIVPETEVVNAPVTFGDLRSAGNCHEECVGCSESYSATACFSCKHFTQTLRNRAGVKCITHCDSGYYADGDKCRRCSVHCESCTRAEQCETCHGAKLLVDADNIGHHFDHGRCVDACPAGLVADYTNLLQARCVLKRNPCSAGYYENMRSVCVECDTACATCHGAGTLQCDSCSQGYDNRTVGYCRPCCPPLTSVNTSSTSMPERQMFLHDCEPCDADVDTFKHKLYAVDGDEHEESFGRIMFTMILVFLVLCLACAFAQFFCVRWNNGMSVVGSAIGGSGGGASGIMEYTPLRNILDEESEHRHRRKSSSPFTYGSDNDSSSENEDNDDGMLNSVRSSGRVKVAVAEER